MKQIKLIIFYILKFFGKRVFPEQSLLQHRESKYFYILFEYYPVSTSTSMGMELGRRFPKEP